MKKTLLLLGALLCLTSCFKTLDVVQESKLASSNMWKSDSDATGALYGLNYSTIAASKFKFDTSILVLVFVVLGGIGNIRGSVIAAALLTVLPELLRAFSDYRMLVYAVVLIIVMIAINTPFIMTRVRDLRHFIGRVFGRKGGDAA